MSSKLSSLMNKAECTLIMLQDAKSNCNSACSLWFHSMAILNIIYSLYEELNNKAKNSNDQVLNVAINDWTRFDNKLKNLMFEARNKAVHQGLLAVDEKIEWEIEFESDTKTPRIKLILMVKGTVIDQIMQENFFSLCEASIQEFIDGIIIIDSNYKISGGVENGLSFNLYIDSMSE